MNILITGVSSGLGKQLAVASLSKGHHVWGIARKEAVHPVIQNLLSDKKFSYTRCDVAKEDEVDNLFGEIKRANFNLDIVILNAALMRNDFVDRCLCLADCKEVFNVNLFGAVNIIDKALPVFRQKGKGLFVGVSSLAAHRGVVANKIAYPASKSALNMVFESFRLQLANPEIRFVTVNLGPLAEEGSFLKTSYAEAANKIISLFKKNKNSVNYPFVPFIITKICRILPDSFISRYIIKSK